MSVLIVFDGGRIGQWSLRLRSTYFYGEKRLRRWSTTRKGEYVAENVDVLAA